MARQATKAATAVVLLLLTAAGVVGADDSMLDSMLVIAGEPGGAFLGGQLHVYCSSALACAVAQQPCCKPCVNKLSEFMIAAYVTSPAAGLLA